MGLKEESIIQARKKGEGKSKAANEGGGKRLLNSQSLKRRPIKSHSIGNPDLRL